MNASVSKGIHSPLITCVYCIQIRYNVSSPMENSGEQIVLQVFQLATLLSKVHPVLVLIV